MGRFVPDRKVWAGGIAGVVAWAVMLGLSMAGVQVPPEAQPLIMTIVVTAMGYLVPPSQRDIVKRLNDQLVAVAAADPTIPVTVGSIVRTGPGK